MQLRTATKHDLAVMMGWFPDSHSCRTWGGPEFRFPFSQQSFQEDSRFEVLPSYAYASDRSLIGFGQYYLRAGRCHLSRLAVSPTQRGQGFGSRLLAALAELGSAALGAEQCSLFVAADNWRAAQLYRRLGFEETAYPAAQPPMGGILYLVADARAIRARVALAPGAAAPPRITGCEHARAVLFDLDGTLLDTAPDMVGALNQLRAEERESPLPVEQVRPFVSHGAKALVQVGFPQASGAAFEALRTRFLELYRARLSRETRLYEGIGPALSSLESAGIPWGIVTNKPAWLTEPLLEQLALQRRAGVIVSGDTLEQRKPHPAPLLHAAARLGAPPAHCIYVGDAERDVLAARAAGMRVLVALFGYIPAHERPHEWPASGWLESPAAMARWLESLRP